MTPKRYTNALKRVLAHKRARLGKSAATMEGIYLSKSQLKDLGEKLLGMADGPDGIWFMIGQKSRNERTVELIPYKKVNKIPVFFEKNGIVGDIHIELGTPDADISWPLSIMNNGADNIPPPAPITDPVVPIVAPAGPTVPSQRTPPPFPE